MIKSSGTDSRPSCCRKGKDFSCDALDALTERVYALEHKEVPIVCDRNGTVLHIGDEVTTGGEPHVLPAKIVAIDYHGRLLIYHGGSCDPKWIKPSYATLWKRGNGDVPLDSD